MEFNLLRFLPIISFGSKTPIENRLKYFLVQSPRSAIFLFFSIYAISMSLGEYVIIFALILKLGGAPFHGWFMSLLKRVRIRLYFILASIQKLMPIFIIIHLEVSEILLSLLILSNFIIIFLGGSISANIIKIIAMSSLNRLR